MAWPWWSWMWGLDSSKAGVGASVARFTISDRMRSCLGFLQGLPENPKEAMSRSGVRRGEWPALVPAFHGKRRQAAGLTLPVQYWSFPLSFHKS